MCGAPLENGACDYCGYREQTAAPASPPSGPQPGQTGGQPQVVIQNQTVYNQTVIPGISRKNKLVALLLCIFLGELGIHRFYVGKVGTGILYLFTCGLFGIGWVVDIIRIAMGSFTDCFGLPLRR